MKRKESIRWMLARQRRIEYNPSPTERQVKRWEQLDALIKKAQTNATTR